MKRIFITSAFVAVGIATMAKDIKEVTVANNSRFARTAQPVTVNIDESDNIKSATVTEDGQDYLLGPGDAEYCTGGHTHGIANDSDEVLVFLAIIMK